MRHITPHLWFDKEAQEAAEFYASAFPDAKVTHVSVIHDTPSGDSAIVSFEIAGQPFMAISAGPVFKINPSISFILNFDPVRYETSNGTGASAESTARKAIDDLWAKLSEGGTMRMPLQEYPFSKRYGWIEDRFGVNWQLMLTDPAGEKRPFVTPSLMFTQANAGRAEEAIDFYVSVFKGPSAASGQAHSSTSGQATRGTTARYPGGMAPEKEGTLMYADFCIRDTWLAAMDSAGPHDFVFNEAVSLLIPCETQEDIDYYWEKLSADPKAEQCGWLKDRFGVSWQVWPTAMGEMMAQGTPEQISRVVQAFMPMKKFDIAALRKAYEGA